jgi:hypothetical protein
MKFRIFFFLLNANWNRSWPSLEVVAFQVVDATLLVPGKYDKNKLSKTHLDLLQVSLIISKHNESSSPSVD